MSVYVQYLHTDHRGLVEPCGSGYARQLDGRLSPDNLHYEATNNLPADCTAFYLYRASSLYSGSRTLIDASGQSARSFGIASCKPSRYGS